MSNGENMKKKKAKSSAQQSRKAGKIANLRVLSVKEGDAAAVRGGVKKTISNLKYEDVGP